MKSMREYALEYNRTHKNGAVTKVGDYSLEFTEFPKKETDKPKSYIVMMSYFWKPSSDLAQ